MDKKTNKKPDKKKLTLERKSSFDTMDAAWHDESYAFAERYRNFLDFNRTERECVASFAKMAVEHGFVEYVPDESKPGAPGYIFIGKGKAIALYRPGKKPAKEGVNLIIAHIDSPRLDLKVNPLLENADFAMLKTHYYGGIRKHQWLSRPLAIHGVIIRADGTEINLRLGSEPGDPVFVISDLEPHLSHKAQNDKKVNEFYPAEKLNLIAGIIPDEDEDAKERVKLAVLAHLNEKYGMTEEDFVSAELEVVPAEKSCDVGFDRAILGGYGHDDRVCSFMGVRALLESETPEKGALAIAVDKEEIGSAGASGADSVFVMNVLAEILVLEGNTADIMVRRAAERTNVISADVAAGLHPDWQEVQEKNNAARLGYGITLTKYTGARGKGGANDANAEFMFRLRKLWNETGIPWQTGQLGKIDEGGGGTVAKFLAYHGMNVVDSGPALLGMHAPMELVAKSDIYAGYLAYKAVFEKLL